ncbi:MAG: hypothetical protein ACD_40C00232G0002 [uncultured bacterium]|uniref:Glycosyl hydrolase-like 10 domain-containing protein n=2 Tax=Candidatus Collieribacteriota TaxID=1752725 RepID=A0A1F5FZG5_9BACT|nr:MAG: hypothetical protein ACD_40C00232G0002 [uncultured bacterium]KKU20745.1 MAG: hypothetical protein UX32_C0015G0003 [Microgenomates group bacterium GW2011_GWF1_46_12]KKU25839.1 MAG: hypothetical protein UX38_C0014G0004 [Microgenomates group bacterium GW2011_GWC1_46_16]KKU27523.1 MAG: hypothetical protein UX40_C0012G0004 [Microgenomates group bacterium GW2011_GWF2_46_18]KKU44606.1 MAG: hypothetical protein UX63_C0029G0002 [Microgenomates group bacterium GW2011_GWB1_46_7]KKU59923.1 MAG: hy
MTKLYFLLINLFFIVILSPAHPALAVEEAPLLTVYSGVIGRDVSQPDFLDDLIALNPLYYFANPFHSQSVLTTTRIQEIHSQLPRTQIIRHLTCCSLFNQKKLDSPIAQINFSTQNTQAEFDDAWANHRDAFMKNSRGEYVYHQNEPNGEMWVNPEQGYLLDPASSFYKEFLYDKIKEHILTSGYDGVYLDLMYPVFMNTFYYSVPAINSHPITDQQWRDKLISLNRYLQNRRQNDPNPKMRNALIITNSVGGGPGDSNDPIDRVQFNRDLQTQGVQIENPFYNFATMSHNNWLAKVNQIRDISSLRNNRMTGWLNYHHADKMDDQAQCDQHSLFAYTSYLLGNNSPNFAFYFLCKIQEDNRVRRIHASEKLTRISLGTPSSAYQQLASGLYVREYTHGFAIVNPTSSALNYKPNTNLYNAYSSTTYPQNINLTLSAKTGLVLLKNAPSTLPADFNSDGTVNLLDYNLLKTGFGTTYNLLDYNTLRSQWGQ